MNTEPDGISDRFLRETALTWEDLIREHPPRERPPRRKIYQAEGPTTVLPPPRAMALTEVLAARRSVREFAEAPLTLEELSSLLFAARGVTGHREGQPICTIPSGGALYPVEVYVVAHRVAGLTPGVHHLSVEPWGLELVREGEWQQSLVNAGLKQELLGRAAAVFAFTGMIERSRFKYGERAMRYILLEAGHASQNVYLMATALGLASVAAGAFVDEELNRLLGIDGISEAALYLHAVGRPLQPLEGERR